MARSSGLEGSIPGFSVNEVTVVSFELPAAHDDAQSEALLADLTGALRESPGNAFGFASREPLAQSRAMTHIRLPGASTAQPKSIIYLDVSPGYFDVLRIPIVAGRPFRSAETPGAGAVLINESMARLYWPNVSPVGKIALVQSQNQSESREIVGVVRNAYTVGLNGVEPMFYQHQPLSGGRRFPKLLVRASAPVSANIAKLVARLDSRLRVQATPLSANLSRELESSRYGATLASMLGAGALALATMGTFGVFAYAVRQRTREIGIRVALGHNHWPWCG